MGSRAQGGEPITGVRFFGSPRPPLELVEEARIFTIGSGACDLVVPEELARGVALVHATIERIEAAIRVRDLISRHGLYRSPHLEPVVELLLHSGEIGWIGRCAILAVDERMERLRSRFAWSMGLDAHVEVDQAIASAVDGSPIALVGPATLDATHLARAIHDAGGGRDRTFVVCGDGEVPPIASADGTVAIDLDRARRVPASLVAAMFSPMCPARVIFLSSDDRVLRRHLDTYADRVRSVGLVPIARRRHELSRLLQRVWRDEMGSDRRVEDLDPRALRGMSAHSWRGNFDELRAMAVRLLAYVEHPSLRRAALALGVRHQTLAQHLHRIGVPILDQADRDI